jgi:Rrf2 family protein
VRLRRSTRYGLYAAAELARAGGDDAVTVGRVADAYGIPLAALAKVFQRLVREGIATGTRGSGGGYRLAVPAAEVSLLQVVEAFEPVRSPGTCVLAETSARCCDDPAACALRLVLDEVDDTTRTTFAAISLETLVRPRGGVRERGTA